MRKLGGVGDVVEGLKPAMLMVVLQITYAGINVLYKIAVNDGMNLRILIAYRYMFATLFIAPLALFLERNKRPKMTWSVLSQAFLCGLFGGVMSQNFYLESLALTSATFASAMSNLTPAVTFLMAVSVRLERLNLRTVAGQVKIIGTIVAIGGAMVLTFFKSTKIDTGSFHITLLHHRKGQVASLLAPSSMKALLGALCSLGSSATYALWLIIQAKMSKSYPCYYSSTALMSSMAALLSTALAICLESDLTQWKLGWDVRLLTVAYAGIVVSGIMVVVMAWCVDMKGPLYVSAFNPLLLVFVAIAGSFMLDEKLYLGSIIGGMLIVCGLYMVLWGKGKEMKMNPLVPSQSSLPEVIIVRSSPTDEKSSPQNKNHN
ncbi:WAT1-related protein At1g68170-like isoform X1 [Prosopis cineraria]|uniref:WAT1-related protein At1g68170-like isoform X1 n=1 Tax=Prosopis cineraria TaxID=364024 RepID=UPI00240EBA29|nr:WAT1-related protein At1g68170-like isoform X1 [Prosopis cineraria]